jgi:hypothetical protein
MRRLREISEVPAEERGEWLSSAESSVEFLKENMRSERIVIYASMSCVFIHAVLAPLKHLNPPDHAELRNAFVQLDSSWMIEHVSGGGEPPRLPRLAAGWPGQDIERRRKAYFSEIICGDVGKPHRA